MTRFVLVVGFALALAPIAVSANSGRQHGRPSSTEYRLQVLHSELERLDERMSLQEELIEALRSDLSQNKDVPRLLERVSTLERSNKSVSGDLSRIRSHSNDTAGHLQALTRRQEHTDRELASQEKNIARLEAALKTLVAAMEGTGASGKVYVVQPGDNLDKIARQHHTQVSTLKQLNDIDDANHIRVGQEIRLP